MKYALLIYGNQARVTTPEEDQQEMNDYWAYGNEAQERRLYIVGEALHPTNTATTVRVRDGKTVTTDGPFAETHEQLGGFYLLDCKDLDEAIEMAAKIPGARYGSVEIRPVVNFG